jgi:hypothetical protein
MIHAEIFRKMMEAAKQGNLSPSTMTTQQQIDYVNSLRNNFPGIYDYYIQRYKPSWNHNMMAQHYRNVIADILQEFDNSSKPRSVYESLSWVGLRELEDLTTSVAWDALSQAEQQTVINNINTYFHNGDSTCN